MAAATALKSSVPTGQKHDQSVEEKIQKFRDLFADAPEIGKKALENAIHELRSQTSDLPPPVESAGRVGARLGKVSELTIIVPLAPGGAKRLRAFLRLLRGNLSQGADKVGTLQSSGAAVAPLEFRPAQKEFTRRLAELERAREKK